MNWKRRFAEMMLAGGAVALGVGYDVACTPSSEANFCCNANGDPCCAVENCGAPMNPECQAERSCVADGGDYENGSCLYDAGDAAVTPPPFPCCNANGDPCCTFLHCDAGITPQCQAELACIDAGLWDAGALVCVAPTDDDASTEDAGADADASSDASAEGAADGASDVDAHD